MCGQVSHTAEPRGTPNLSPVANDDSTEGGGLVPNRTNEEASHRYCCSSICSSYDRHCHLSTPDGPKSRPAHAHKAKGHSN